VGVLDAIAAKRSSIGAHGRKAWSEQPFWAFDDLRLPLLASTPLTADKERIETNFEGYVQAAYRANGVVFACLLVRQLIFAEARFMWRSFSRGRPQELFSTSELDLLDEPWPGGTTGDLLARMEVTASLAGNYYATTADDQGRLGRSARGPGRRIVHLRPDWVTLVVGSPSDSPLDPRAKVVAVDYQPPPQGGVPSEPWTLLPSEVCHYSPLDDPLARWRGMSWLTPIVEEIRADKAATMHKGRFFTNGATPSMAIVFDKEVKDERFQRFVAEFKANHQGADKAYKTLFLAGGADVRTLGRDFQQLDFKVTQGGGEERIMAAAGVHPAVVGLAGGLEGASLNAGNFGAAARLTANKTMKPLWRRAAAALQALVMLPYPAASLWFDDRDIAFLREDASDLAKIRAMDAQALRTLTDGGFDPDAAVRFVQTNDLNQLLGSHSGLLPVQMRPPGSGEESPTANGNGQPRELVR
jgi:phage portal protein BeeE